MMNFGQRVQVAAKRLAARLMQGTLPQSDSTIEVSVSITIRDEGGNVTLSASEMLLDEAELTDGRDLKMMVAE